MKNVNHTVIYHFNKIHNKLSVFKLTDVSEALLLHSMDNVFDHIMSSVFDDVYQQIIPPQP